MKFLTVLSMATLLATVASADTDAALTQACEGGDVHQIIEVAFDSSGYDNHLDPDAYIQAVESWISPRVVHPLSGAICSLLPIENARHRNYMIGGLMGQAEVASVDSFDQFLERLSSRLGIDLPPEILIPLRAEISVAQIRVDAENAEIRADLAAQDNLISDLQVEYQVIRERIAENEQRMAES